MDLGTKIYERRHELGLRQVDLAHNCGMSQESISQIERGHINPTLASAFRIASTLGWSLSELFEGVTSGVGFEEDLA